LHTGPKFNQSIFDILLRFRIYKVALIADIEKAFLMILIDKKDRDVLRFLWIDDTTKDSPTFIILRFTRVVFGVTSSPFLLNATIRYHLEQFRESHDALIYKLLRSFYVDDLVTGASTEEEAFGLFSDAKTLMSKGGFNLCKFHTNSKSLQSRIDAICNGVPWTDEEVETYARSTLANVQRSSDGDKKVLGVLWDTNMDEFVLDFSSVLNAVNRDTPSKRHIVSLASKFYDPIGLAAPVIVKFKVLVQELCLSKLGWDEILTGKLLEKWQLLLHEFKDCQPVRISRCYTQALDGVESYQLCGFCDASNTAYAAVIYLLMRSGETKRTMILTSKTRVAPMQQQTIPRLELLGALLLSRLIKKVTNILNTEIYLEAPVCFTDSQVVLCWIKGADKDWKPFIQNRVMEVRRSVPVGCWRFCSGKDNPADLPSRGISIKQLKEGSLWWSGPPWLREGGINSFVLPQNIPLECLAELKSTVPSSHVLVNNEIMSISKVMDIERYSSLSKLLKVTSLLILFKHKLVGRATDNDSNLLVINEAEQIWLLEVQRVVTTSKEFMTLKRQLDLFCDEKGIWRCGGRIHHSDFPYATRHPILLPRKHYYTLLCIKEAHQRVCHNGVKETLTELRTKYWVAKGRMSVQNVISKCNLCRRYGGLTYRVPPPPPLPSFRVTELPPFSYTGVDYAGPLHVKPDYPAHALCEQKVWICLYTCCITRAVHIDIVSNLSTPSFIRSLKRFISRRGLPHRMISDNGTTFKSAAKELQRVVNDKEVKKYLSDSRVVWTFNIEKAPWWGGIFERMIGLTKKCLRKIIGRAKFSFDELLTAVTEIESVLNSRPISYVSSTDLEEPLTPFHLLVGRRLSSLPDELCYRRVAMEYTTESSPILLNRRLKYLHLILDKFWLRWKNEYLLNLREQYIKMKQSPNARLIQVDDVVVIQSDECPRGFWKLGKVTELIMGKDKEVRGGVVKTLTGNKSTFLKRPVQHLIPLEVYIDETNEDHIPEVGTEEACSGTEGTQRDNEIATQNERPRRVAAIEARDKIVARLCED
jgi:hypothetical protein